VFFLDESLRNLKEKYLKSIEKRLTDLIFPVVRCQFMNDDHEAIFRKFYHDILKAYADYYRVKLIINNPPQNEITSDSTIKNFSN
jgi:hypothetical protein